MKTLYKEDWLNCLTAVDRWTPTGDCDVFDSANYEPGAAVLQNILRCG